MEPVTAVGAFPVSRLRPSCRVSDLLSIAPEARYATVDPPITVTRGAGSSAVVLTA